MPRVGGLLRRAVLPVLEALEARWLLAAGTLDPTFGNGGKLIADFGGFGPNTLRDLAALADGSTVAVGDVSGNIALARYTAAGQLDTSFGDAGRVVTDLGGEEYGNAVEVQPDGKIVVAGGATIFNWGTGIFAARYNPDGSLDHTFGQAGKVTILTGGHANDLAIQADGKLVLAGWVYNGAPTGFLAMRLNADGSPDTSFDGDGKVVLDVTPNTPYETASSVGLGPGGTIVLGGWGAGASFNDDDFALVRLRADGSYDPAFGGGSGKVLLNLGSTADRLQRLVVLPSGKIVATGLSASGGAPIVRFNADGTPDGSFGAAGVARFADAASLSYGRALAVAADGSVLVAAAESGKSWVARYKADGTRDTAFGVSGRAVVDHRVPAYAEEPTAIAIRPSDGAIIVGGTVDGPSSAAKDMALARLSATGQVTSGWGGTLDFPGPVFDEFGDMVELPGGKVLVVGARAGCTNCDGSVAAARFNADGSPDQSFGTGGRAYLDFGSDPDIRAVAVQGDGKFIVVGSRYVSGEGPNFIAARFNADGTPDSGFGVGGKVTITAFQTDQAGDVLLQDDGKIVLVGTAYVTSGYRWAMVRLNADGTIDTGFGDAGRLVTTMDATVSSDVMAAVRQPDGKFIIGGRAGLARFNADWTPDLTFDGDGKRLITSVNATTPFIAYDLEVDSHGRIVALTSQYSVMRFNADGSNDLAFNGTGLIGPLNFGHYSGAAQGLAVDEHDRIVVAGTASEYAGNSRWVISRFLADGRPDLSFGADGVLKDLVAGYYHVSFPGEVLVLGDGKILAGGVTQSGPTSAEGWTNYGPDLALLRIEGVTPLTVDAGGAYTVAEGGVMTLAGSAKLDAMQSVSSYEWDLDYDGVTFNVDATGREADFSAAGIDGPGSRTVALRVRTADGQTDIDMATVRVVNAPPAIRLSGTGMASGGTPYTLSISYAEPAGNLDTISSVTVDWGDGTVQTVAGKPAQLTHTYAAGRALYHATLRATDEDGTYAAATHAIRLGGALDPTFGTGGKVVTDLEINDTPSDMLALPDGRFIVLVGGTRLTAFQADGSIDGDFGTDGVVQLPFAIKRVLRTADGKLIAAGTQVHYPGVMAEHNDLAVMRLLADGSPDASFGVGGLVNLHLSETRSETLTDAVVLPNGRLLLAGTVKLSRDGWPDVMLVRLREDGTLDGSFGVRGRVVTDLGPDLKPDQVYVAGGPGGRAYALVRSEREGSSYNWAGTLLAYKADGTLESAFDGDGVLQVDGLGGPGGIVVQADGKVLLAGGKALDPGPGSALRLMRLLPSGAVDATYGAGAAQDGVVTLDLIPGSEGPWAVVGSHDALDPAGNLVIAGLVESAQERDIFAVRIRPDGAADTSFGHGGAAVLSLSTGMYDWGVATAVLASGQVLLAGSGLAAAGLGSGSDLGVFRLGDARHEVSVENTGPAFAAGSPQVPAAVDEGAPLVVRGTIVDPDTADAHTVTVKWGDGSPDTVLELPPGVLAFETSHPYADNLAPWTGTVDRRVVVKVSDGLLAAESAARVVVNNVAPVVDLGPDRTALEHEVLLIPGAFTDAGSGDGHTYRWELTTPSSAFNSPVFTRDYSLQLKETGFYTLKLTVTDDDGASHSDELRIEVGDAPPVVDLGPDRATLEAEQTWVQNKALWDVAAWQWTVRDAAGNVVTTSTRANAIDVRLPDDGAYTVELTATDEEGNTLSDSVTVTALNRPPTATAGLDQTAAEGSIVHLLGGGEDPSALDTLSWAWTVTGPDGATSTWSEPSFAFMAPDNGTYTATFTVTDDDGGSRSDTAVITVTNVAPSLALEGARSVAEGGAYVLRLLSRDPGADTISSWLIDWGDGTPPQTVSGNPQEVTHVYRDGPATQHITATATDEDGSYTVRTAAGAGATRLDPAFGTGGTVVTQRGGAFDAIEAMVVQGDGKIVVAGSAGPQNRAGIFRYNANGTVDSSFQSRILDRTSAGGDGSLVQLPDGKILMAASHIGTAPDGSDRGFIIMQMWPWGAPHSSFGTGGGGQAITSVGGTTYSPMIAALPDGRFYVAATHYPSNGSGFEVAVVRYLQNGQLDAAFGVRKYDFGSADDVLVAVAAQSDGKLLLSGLAQTAGAVTGVLMRINTDGSPDATFGQGGKVSGTLGPQARSYLSSLTLLPDGKILAGTDDARLIRLNSDGSPDLSFGPAGMRAIAGLTGGIAEVAIDPFGRIILHASGVRVARLRPDFTLDTSFGDNGTGIASASASSTWTSAMTLLPGGDVLLAGQTGPANVDGNHYLARFLGSLPPVTVTNVAPALTIGGAGTVADAAAYTLTLSAADPAPDTISQWVIDWGDGTPLQTVSGSPSSVTHVFADGVGTYTVTANARDEDGTYNANSHSVTVTGTPRAFVFTDANLSLSAPQVTEGGSVSLSGAFTDARAPHTVTIDWGDGTTPTTINLPAGVYAFSAAHRYEDDPAGPGSGAFNIAVTVSSSAGARSASATLNVLNAAPTVEIGPDRAITEGTTIGITPTITDAGTRDTLTYRWEITPAGGATQVLTTRNASFLVPDDGVVNVKLTVTDDDGASTTDTLTVTASNQRPTLTATGAATATQGTPYTLSLAASDVGSDTISAWQIDWGDGAVQSLPGAATSASHVYEDAPSSAIIRIKAADEDGTYDVPVVAGTPGGAMDVTFDGDGRVPSVAFSGYAKYDANDVAVQPDGKVLIAGNLFVTWNPWYDADAGLVRLNRDGSLDTTFGNGGRIISRLGALPEMATEVAVGPDGRIYIAGGVQRTTGVHETFVYRYLAGGTLDPAWGAGTGRIFLPINQTDSHELIVLDDGGVLVGGSTVLAGTNTRFAVAKLTPSGTLDAAFGAAGWAYADFASSYDRVLAMTLAPNGSIIAVGTSNKPGIANDSTWAVARFTPGGILDASFNGTGMITLDWGAGFDNATGVAVTPDGKIVISGSRQTGVSGVQEIAVARFNPDGTPDLSFATAGKLTTRFTTSQSDYASDMALTAGGTITITGNSGAQFAALRLLSDGTRDPSFGANGVVTVAAPSSWAPAMDVAPDGRLVMVGADFSAVRLAGGGLRILNAWPAELRGTPGDDVFVARLAAGGQYVELFENTPTSGPPTYILPVSAAATLRIVPSGGNDTLIVQGGAYTLDLAGQKLGRLELAGNARVALPSGASVLRLGALEIAPAARLDIAAGGLILDAPAAQRDAILAQLAGWARSARSIIGAPRWAGPGIGSSVAAADSRRITGVGIASNHDLLLADFMGHAVDAEVALVRFTYEGDANLDGRVNISDFFRIDHGAATGGTGFIHGDFDHGGLAPTADDYMIIDRAFLAQAAPLAAAPPAPAIAPTPVSADDTRGFDFDVADAAVLDV